MSKLDSRFLFRPDLLWPKDKETAPFFTAPAWWRRFIFQVLTPRELSVYHYYLSVMNTVGVAFPSLGQISADLDLADRDAIRKAQETLVTCGFLLKPDAFQIELYSMAKRPIFQRPCTQYTVRTLLNGKVDGDLFPAGNRLRTEYAITSESVVLAGLKILLGPAYEHYKLAYEMQDAERDTRLTAVLKQLLDEALAARATTLIAQTVKKAKRFDPASLNDASPAIKAAFGIGPPLVKKPLVKKPPSRPAKKYPAT